MGKEEQKNILMSLFYQMNGCIFRKLRKSLPFFMLLTCSLLYAQTDNDSQDILHSTLNEEDKNLAELKKSTKSLMSSMETLAEKIDKGTTDVGKSTKLSKKAIQEGIKTCKEIINCKSLGDLKDIDFNTIKSLGDEIGKESNLLKEDEKGIKESFEQWFAKSERTSIVLDSMITNRHTAFDVVYTTPIGVRSSSLRFKLTIDTLRTVRKIKGNTSEKTDASGKKETTEDEKKSEGGTNNALKEKNLQKSVGIQTKTMSANKEETPTETADTIKKPETTSPEVISPEVISYIAADMTGEWTLPWTMASCDATTVRFKGENITLKGEGESKLFLDGGKNTQGVLFNLICEKVSLFVDKESYVLIDCNGFKELHLKGYFAFSSNIMYSTKKTKERNGKNKIDDVIADFETTIEDLDDFYVVASIRDSFKVRCTGNVKYMVKDVIADFSTKRNAPSFAFPHYYKNPFAPEDIDLWTGFCMMNVTADFSEEFPEFPLKKVTADTIIVDEMGFSGHVAAQIANDNTNGNDGFTRNPTIQYRFDKVELSAYANKIMEGGLEGLVKIMPLKSGGKTTEVKGDKKTRANEQQTKEGEPLTLKIAGKITNNNQNGLQYDIKTELASDFTKHIPFIDAVTVTINRGTSLSYERRLLNPQDKKSPKEEEKENNNATTQDTTGSAISDTIAINSLNTSIVSTENEDQENAGKEETKETEELTETEDVEEEQEDEPEYENVFTFILNATLDVDNKYVIIKGLSVEGLKLTSSKPYAYGGKWNLQALEVPYLHGLPFGLKNISLRSLTKEIYITPEIFLNLIGGGDKKKGVSVEGNFDLIADVKEEIKDWAINGLHLNSIKVDVDYSAFHLKGFVDGFRDDPMYGDGFKGGIDFSMKAPRIDVGAEAWFGKTKSIYVGTQASENSKGKSGETATPTEAPNAYRYWYVYAHANLPNVLIFPPAVMLSSVSLAAYDRVDYDFDREECKISNVYPNKNMGFGFKAGVGLCIAQDNLINALVIMGIDFTSSGGIARVSLDGKCALLCKEPDDGFMVGTVNTTYDFQNEIFKCDIAAQTGSKIKKIINGKAEMNIFSSPEKWYCNVGTYENPVSLKFIGLLKASTYLMCGHGVPATLPPLDPTITEKFNITQSTATATDHTEEFKSGQGVAFGAAVSVSCYLKAFAYADFTFMGGTDLLVVRIPGMTCAGSKYRASGRVYVYLDAGAGIRFRKKKFEVVEIAALADLEGELPKPMYIHGRIHFKYRLLGGFVKGHAKVHYKTGQSCNWGKDGNEVMGELYDAESENQQDLELELESEDGKVNSGSDLEEAIKKYNEMNGTVGTK